LSSLPEPSGLHIPHKCYPPKDSFYPFLCHGGYLTLGPSYPIHYLLTLPFRMTHLPRTHFGPRSPTGFSSTLPPRAFTTKFFFIRIFFFFSFSTAFALVFPDANDGSAGYFFPPPARKFSTIDSDWALIDDYSSSIAVFFSWSREFLCMWGPLRDFLLFFALAYNLTLPVAHPAFLPTLSRRSGPPPPTPYSSSLRHGGSPPCCPSF